MFVKEKDPDVELETAEYELKAESETSSEYLSPEEIELEIDPVKEAEGITEAKEPFAAGEFGLESLGLSKFMPPDEVIALLGDPGEIVLNSYLRENEVPNRWTDPVTAGVYDISDHFVELYYFEPDDEGLVKIGIMYYDELTGAPARITYSQYIPYTCASSRITFFIEDDVVTEIKRSGA